MESVYDWAKFKTHLREISFSLTFDLLLMKMEFSDLIQFLATESPLKMMENAFNFTLNALDVLKIFKSWS